MSVKEITDRKRKKEEKKTEKNTDRIQTKLNFCHIRYNAKILPQESIIRDKQISEEYLERKVLGIHTFPKKIISNQLNIFFLNKLEENL